MLVEILLIINLDERSTETIKKLGIQGNQAVQTIVIQCFAVGETTQELHTVYISEDALLVDTLTEDIGCSFTELVCFIYNHKAASTKQGGVIVIELGLLCHEVQVVVGDLEVQILVAEHRLDVLAVAAVLEVRASRAGAFDADPALDLAVQLVFIQIDKRIIPIRCRSPHGERGMEYFEVGGS